MNAKMRIAAELVTASGEPAILKDPNALDVSHGLIILLMGLPAVGKSTLSMLLCRELNASIIDRDAMVKAIYPEPYCIWTRSQVKLAGEICAQVAEQVLLEQPGARLIIDGFTFSRKADIDDFVDVARRTECRIIRILCFADEEEVRSRIETDKEGLAKGRDWTMYTRVRDRFEPLEKIDIKADLTNGPEDSCKRILDYLEGGGERHGW